MIVPSGKRVYIGRRTFREGDAVPQHLMADPVVVEDRRPVSEPEPVARPVRRYTRKPKSEEAVIDPQPESTD